MDTMAYFCGSWYLTASFLLSVLPEVFWNIGLFGLRLWSVHRRGSCPSARAVYSKILDIIPF